MIWLVGKVLVGAEGRKTFAIHQARSEETGKVYYFYTIVDNKTKQILQQDNISKEMLSLFVTLINDARLMGMKI